MTAPVDSLAPSRLPPLGIRVAATLTAVVGLVSAVGVLSAEAQMAALPNRPWFALVLNPVVVLGVLVAAVMLWRRQRIGAYLLLGAAILPNLSNLAYGAPLRAPGLLMILAIITVAANWQLLK